MAYIDRVLKPSARLAVSILALLTLAAPSLPAWSDGWLDGWVDSVVSFGSFNWAGRLDPGPGVRSVDAIFNVPAASQRNPGEAEYASLWDGIGGAMPGTTALVQAGLHIYVSPSGEASYSTFVEGLAKGGGFLFSGTPVQVSAGQWIEVQVSQTGPDEVTYRIDDLTSGVGYEKPFSFPADGTSAEWIVEAPTINGGIAPTPRLSPVNFVYTAVNGHPGRAAYGITLLSPSHVPLYTPSRNQGERFSVCPGAACAVGGGPAFHVA